MRAEVILNDLSFDPQPPRQGLWGLPWALPNLCGRWLKGFHSLSKHVSGTWGTGC